MNDPTQASTRVPRAEADDAATGPGRRQGVMALGLLVAVVLLDQTTKWWGWRYAPDTFINSGGTWLIGRPVSGWFSGPVSGPLLDHLNVGLLGLAAVVLMRRRRRARVLVAGALMIGGWGSNLLDRLGMHSVTAPGSARGAVDFIPLGPPHWNVADFVIFGATVLFLVAVCARDGRSSHRAPAVRPATPGPPALATGASGGRRWPPPNSWWRRGRACRRQSRRRATSLLSRP
jgi:MYXO-CTERM domain-containing protein